MMFLFFLFLFIIHSLSLSRSLSISATKCVFKLWQPNCRKSSVHFCCVENWPIQLFHMAFRLFFFPISHCKLNMLQNTRLTRVSMGQLTVEYQFDHSWVLMGNEMDFQRLRGITE